MKTGIPCAHILTGKTCSHFMEPVFKTGGSVMNAPCSTLYRIVVYIHENNSPDQRNWRWPLYLYIGMYNFTGQVWFVYIFCFKNIFLLFKYLNSYIGTLGRIWLFEKQSLSLQLHTTSVGLKESTIPVTLIPGDGVGPELMDSVQSVFKSLGAPVTFETMHLSEVSFK